MLGEGSDDVSWLDVWFSINLRQLIKKVMKTIFLIAALVVMVATASAQHNKLYDSAANAEKDIAEAVEKAASEKKHVLLMAGGNWCSWCLRFNKFVTEDKQLDSILQADYVLYHLNFSKENKNEATFARYDYAQRFGFPVFIVLNERGGRLHTQNSGLLEEGKGYSKDKVKEFLLQWNRKAVDPASYKQ